MVNRFRPIPIESEAVLEQLIIGDPECIEEGIKVLDNQVPAGSGFIDVLAVDAEKTFVVVELKKEESDRSLVQTLEYYDFIRENIAHFANIYRPKQPVDEHAEPRIVLVAHSFSDTVQTAAKYVNAPLALYTYEYLQLGDKKALYLSEVPIAEPTDFQSRRKSPTEQLEKIKNPEVRALCDKVIAQIMALEAANITSKGLRGRIALKYNGRNLVNIWPRQSWFLLKLHKQPRIRIAAESDLPTDFFDNAKQLMKGLAGEQGEDDDEDQPDDHAE